MSTAFAKPSSSFEVVTRRARAMDLAARLCPIAIERPECANISTSFGMSPIVAICVRRDARTVRERKATTPPLFALGWVTSR